ncbi:hypothetical protein THTE_0594 [Thermogutta terrifontis]|uniref:Uncharacterized protein n=1 Tax=Thermogutta terrifontis TaxID=1331910 RepID=A0A286RB53_9BACT|nr:hypothetical protein THTE_0594 [Thermogutta terrifontis]
MIGAIRELPRPGIVTSYDQVSPGTTSVPLRPWENPSRGNIASEGPACRVRLSTLDDPL